MKRTMPGHFVLALLAILSALSLLTGCTVVQRVELSGMQAATGLIGADTWDDLLVNFTEKETNLVYLTNSADCNVALLPSAIEDSLLDN